MKIKKNLGQSSLEYALLISITVTALVVMAVYVQRSIKANFKITEEQINLEQKRNLYTPPSPPPPESEYELCMKQCYSEFYDDYEKLQQCYEGCELLRL